MYIKKKQLIIIFFVFCLLYFFMMDFFEIIDFFKFDVNAPDLVGDGTLQRNLYFRSKYDPAVMYGFLLSITNNLLPLMFLVGLYYYSKLKNKVVVKLIGKNKAVGKVLFTLKLKTAMIPLSIYWAIMLIYTLVSVYLTGFRVRVGADYKGYVYSSSSIFYFLDDSKYRVLIFYFLVSGIYIVATMLLLSSIVDYKYNYIVISILYFIIMRIGDSFIKLYFHKLFYLSASLYVLDTGIIYDMQVFVSYIYMLIVYLFFRLTHQKEF